MTDYAREAAEQISARLFGRGDEPMTRIIEPFIAAAIDAATREAMERAAAEWAEISGKSPLTIGDRIRLGWSVKKPFFAPVAGHCLPKGASLE